MHNLSLPRFFFLCVCVVSCLLEPNVKPISKPLIQLAVQIYCGAANANL